MLPEVHSKHFRSWSRHSHSIIQTDSRPLKYLHKVFWVRLISVWQTVRIFPFSFPRKICVIQHKQELEYYRHRLPDFRDSKGTPQEHSGSEKYRQHRRGGGGRCAAEPENRWDTMEETRMPATTWHSTLAVCRKLECCQGDLPPEFGGSSSCWPTVARPPD